MLRSFTKSSSPPSSIPMCTLSLSVPSSPRTILSCQKTDSIRIMTKSTCASYSGWATVERRVNLCMRVSRHYSRSWDFRSNLSQTKMRYRIIPELLIPAMANTQSIHKTITVLDHRDGPDEHLSTLCTMRSLKAQERLDRGEHRYQASMSVNNSSWTPGRQQELPPGRLKRRHLIRRPSNRRHCRLGGVG